MRHVGKKRKEIMSDVTKKPKKMKPCPGSLDLKSNQISSQTVSELQSDFIVGKDHLRVNWGGETSVSMSPVAMTESLILHPVLLPTNIVDGAKVKESKDNFFLLWNKKGERGISPVAGHMVEVDGLHLNVGGLYPMDSMGSTSLAKRWLNGESVELMTEYAKNLTQIRARVEFPDETTLHIATLYRISTHFHPAFDTFPFLDFLGPPASGKTRANYTVAAASLHPMLTPDLSSAAFYHLRQSTGCTLVIDEKKISKRDEGAMADLVNSAYKRGGRVYRMGKTSSGEFKPSAYSVYGPIQYSGTQILPQMTSTRALTIPMMRTLNQDYSGYEDLLPESPRAEELRENLYLARLEYGFKAREIYQSITPVEFNLRNREWELAHPLLTVAKLIDFDALTKHVLAFFRQINEGISDITDRDEYKVLTVLNSLVTGSNWKDQGYPAMDITTRIITQFDEDSVEWKPKRVIRACRLLNIGTYLSGGKTKLRIRKSHIMDLSSRYLTVEQDSLSENSSTQSTHSTHPGELDSFLQVEHVEGVEQTCQPTVGYTIDSEKGGMPE